MNYESADQQILDTKPRGTSSIEFLPSLFGSGYSGSIGSQYTADEDDEGWATKGFRGCGGVAIKPSKPFASNELWGKIVLKRLENDNGVIFLTEEEADQYIKAEGKYWLWQWGGIRIPFWQKILWTIRKPPTPINDTAVFRYNHRQGHADEFAPVGRKK